MRVPPPFLALVAALAQWALTRGTRGPGPARAAMTATVSAGSTALAATTASRFRRTGTTIDPFRPDRSSTLVTTGANAITRNPMYLGLTGLLIAHAIWRRSWAALIPVAVFGVLIDRLQIPAEESALAATFGAEYDAYRAATPRWLDQRSLRRRPQGSTGHPGRH